MLCVLCLSAEDPLAPTWDCRPADLPRHWRINNQVHFQAVAEDGQLLERQDSSSKHIQWLRLQLWLQRYCRYSRNGINASPLTSLKLGMATTLRNKDILKFMEAPAICHRWALGGLLSLSWIPVPMIWMSHGPVAVVLLTSSHLMASSTLTVTFRYVREIAGGVKVRNRCKKNPEIFWDSGVID